MRPPGVRHAAVITDWHVCSSDVAISPLIGVSVTGMSQVRVEGEYRFWEWFCNEELERHIVIKYT